ncbi:phosphotriesterase-related protein [Rhodococcus sp. IEGM 1307]|jgi:phosphotriesterase-related protein|uniref:phosphotriesterase family protein n=1 Tax=Rhodococcus sp. IEGM 1307 TaxID=3047091 RepID=UPI0024B7122F|nr:phosphotriesterase-related protein [Rhodococcus sp. IEGM 1307]MDI9973819.1 phosphotriesterase-related protein [Rhodococcus sp. IEGM 1307]
MSMLETVRGPRDLASLGKVLMHEHVFILTPDVHQNYGDEYWDEDKRIADAISKLKTLKGAGIDTIVDPTVVGLGRDIPRIQQVNAEVDINIVAATGLYTYDEIPHYFSYRGPGALFDMPEPMTEMFVRDIEEGIGGTGVKAAFLECVVEERGLTRDQTRVAKAIAAAHRQTGAPITVHTNAAHQTGRAALDLFREEDVDLSKEVVGHAGDSNDLDYLRWIADQGAVIGCDRFGIDVFNPDPNRIETLATLCRQGYVDSIVLSQDVACYMDYFSGEMMQQQVRKALPNWHYLHILEDVLPALEERGISDEQIRTMLIDNPRRYFEARS